MIATFDAIIESLRKGPNGNAFEKLFFDGDITSYFLIVCLLILLSSAICVIIADR